MVNIEEMVSLVQCGKMEPVNLWLQLKRFIKSIVGKYESYAEMDDLMQESYFGFLSALRLYKPGDKTTFTTYCRYWIIQAVSRYIDNSGAVVRVPVHASNMVKRYRRIKSSFQRDVRRDPTDQELCEALGIDQAQLSNIIATDNIMQIGSLDVTIGEDDGSTLSDLVQDSAVNIEEEVLERIQAEELSSTLWTIIDNDLTEQQALTIKGRYKESRTLQDIATSLGVSTGRVHNIEFEALRKLRQSRIRKMLEPYLDDVRYSEGIRGSIGGFKKTGMSPTERAVFASLEIQNKFLK